jgi:hypothetical protein
LTDELARDLEALAQRGHPYWPWEQMLRAMRVHLPVLSHVYCVCSRQSLPQAMDFKRIVKQYQVFAEVTLHIVYHGDQSPTVVDEYPPVDGSKVDEPAGFDFEDFDQLAPAIRRLIGRLMGQRRRRIVDRGGLYRRSESDQRGGGDGDVRFRSRRAIRADRWEQEACSVMMSCWRSDIWTCR